MKFLKKVQDDVKVGGENKQTNSHEGEEGDRIEPYTWVLDSAEKRRSRDQEKQEFES